MCEVCHGVSGCPVCSKEPAICPKCNGEGLFYYALKVGTDEAVNVPFELWNRLPANEAEAIGEGESMYRWDTETCSVCKGEGVLNI